MHLRFPGPILSLSPTPAHPPDSPLSLTPESLAETRIPTYKTAREVTSQGRVIAWALSPKNQLYISPVFIHIRA